MSQAPDEEETIPILPLQAPAPTPAPAALPPLPPLPPPDAPLASGAPYRVPAPLVVDPAPEDYSFAAPRKVRPLFGPALSMLGVLLWAFVVFGQFTTSWMFGTPLGQGTAVLAIFLLTFAAWIAAVSRSRGALVPTTTVRFVARAVGIAVLAFLFFVSCVIAATAFGGFSRGHDFLIAFGLVVVSLVAAIAGPRLTTATPLQRTHRQRSVLVGLWLVGVLVTLVAGADLASNG